jgi:hypothetical protein
MLALAYLIIVPWRFSETKAHHKFAILAVEAITMIFWFAGFIALAVFLSDRLCRGRVCSAAKAASAFGAFEWYALHPPCIRSYCFARLADVVRIGCSSPQQPPWP